MSFVCQLRMLAYCTSLLTKTTVKFTITFTYTFYDPRLRVHVFARLHWHRHGKLYGTLPGTPILADYANTMMPLTDDSPLLHGDE